MRLNCVHHCSLRSGNHNMTMHSRRSTTTRKRASTRSFHAPLTLFVLLLLFTIAEAKHGYFRGGGTTPRSLQDVRKMGDGGGDKDKKKGGMGGKMNDDKKKGGMGKDKDDDDEGPTDAPPPTEVRPPPPTEVRPPPPTEVRPPPPTGPPPPEVGPPPPTGPPPPMGERPPPEAAVTVEDEDDEEDIQEEDKKESENTEEEANKEEEEKEENEEENETEKEDDEDDEEDTSAVTVDDREDEPAEAIDYDSAVEDVCETHPCVMGDCISVSSPDGDEDEALCSCQPGYVGEFCERSDPCLDSPCENDSTCNSLGRNDGKYICECPKEYVGKHCQYEDPCFPENPCLNGGTCVVLLGSIVDGVPKVDCACAEGFSGKDCGTAEKK
jgi:EGF-like domain